ncbi:MAG: type I restriction endonuclease [Eubacterium sp.]
MAFEENLKNLSSRIESMKDSINTEEATKTSLIMPFFQILGYDVFNPVEFIPEYTADVGIKKGEKIDYAICLNGELTILIEAKCINEHLEKHDSQLFRYFGTTTAKFAILTNGLIYKFYTDLDEQNKMDSTPFFEIDLSDISDNQIVELKKFCKENFDLSKILDTASELKYLSLIKKVLKDEFINPCDDFVKFLLNRDVYEGQKTQNVIEKYKPIVKKSISQYINELVNDKIQSALKNDEIHELPHNLDDDCIDEVVVDENLIVTTDEELQAFYIIKSILRQIIPADRITYKDTRSYFSVIIDKKVTKWICRIYFKETVKFIVINIDGSDERFTIDTIDDIYIFSDELISKTNSILSLM